ncbi:MAG TPA: UDP-N-acetylmuramate:L-alanyl-gamma-D-glutamyl-meso-diaminopimelate ligase [Gallionella sp.]|jgi:UDP-N-acetylmuramate: L-alanyl-gamma-D-glutamyl-meso-diaminopimelate ligase|nr:UDP-N-acetylmuramate:L-alanyl-gamma-D-glutamyl-meso-diaminopimelate ligase [Gallionella sp.]
MSNHIHILGICGTFMGGIAVMARQAGYRVTGCDANVYPPMSTQLEAQGIELIEGFGVEQLELKPDVFVIGNVVSRGNSLMEEILNRNLPYISGPQWLAQNILYDKWVLGVAGTHGKTTTSSMLAWILEYAGLNPCFLIGGVPQNFGVSARLTDSAFFVIEADEYDTAFFDKRSKFVHYHPRTAILNNLEFDHADIFPDLAAIETQFHHLVRTVPGNGLVVCNGCEESLRRVILRGCWTPVEIFGSLDPLSNFPAIPSPQSPPASVRGGERERQSSILAGERANEKSNLQSLGWNIDAGNRVTLHGVVQGTLEWGLLGEHNRMNALAALAAARHAGVPVAQGLAALAEFMNVKRRMEELGTVNGITVYDDFAHHPTAINTTVAGLRHKVGKARILAVLEPRSNTMRLGVIKDALPGSLKQADMVFCYGADLGWDAAAALAPLGDKAIVKDDLNELIEAIASAAKSGDQVLVMSNGGFGGIHEKLLKKFQ